MAKLEKLTNHPLSAERFKKVLMNAEKPSSLLNKVHHNSMYKMMHSVQLQE